MPFLLMILMMNNNLKFLALAALINGTCFSMILPLLAPLTRQLHLSEFQGGVIVSAGAICMALASIWIAKNKSNQSPKQLVNYGFWGMTFTWAIFTLILYFGTKAILPTLLIFILLVLSRASTGIFMALPQIGLQSYVMTHASEAADRSKQMAMFGAMNSFGMIVGPFATSILLFGGLLFPMWIAVALLGLVSIALSILFSKIPKSQTDSSKFEQEEKSTTEHESILKQSFIWLVLGFATYVAIVTLNMTAGFYIQDRFYLSSQHSAIYFSQCMLVVGVCLVLTQLLIVKVLQLKLNSLVIIGLVTMCFGLLLSLYAPTIFVFQASYIFYGVSVACLLPAFTTGAAQAVSQQSQVKMASFCTATQALGLIVGPLLSTFLYRFNTHFPFYLLLFLMLFIGLYFCWFFIRQQQKYLLVE
ncbi:MFS transporter [Acinetobacter gyllenbergii]|uniref:MFS transporter n=1 Tax=Acinetobacter gyllenbergii TaxID=134534 RepID=UPI000806A986|nr:MFS transporter [Acinetobacter gyllenbergii]OBY73096.1 MFS transporter permease [Acinetobacter gyllenbergii]